MIAQGLPALGGALFGAYTPASGGAGASLAGALSVTVSTSGALTVPKPLAGSLSVAVTTTGALAGGGALLAGSLSVAVTTTGALSVPKPLTGALSVAVTTSGALTVRKPLAGSLSVAVSTSGSLNGAAVVGPPAYYDGTIAVLSSYGGTLTCDRAHDAVLALIAGEFSALTTLSGDP